MAWNETPNTLASETMRKNSHVMRTKNGKLTKGGKANSNIDRQIRNPAAHIGKIE